MQQVKLCSESVENSAFFEFGASSSDMASDVWLDSSSTTGAARKIIHDAKVHEQNQKFHLKKTL